MSDSVYFNVPMVPPSVNAYVRHTRTGRHYVSKEAKAFKEAVALFAKGQQIRAKAFCVDITIFLGPGQKGDLDNFAKCVLDGLVEAGIIDSDAKVTILQMAKYRSLNARTRIEIMGSNFEGGGK